MNSFVMQTYASKQLLILDDRQDPSFSEVPRLPSVSYLRSDSRSIAEKRNILCSLSAGDLVCHWDDDDFSAPERIADQVKRLEESGKAVTGFCSMLFYEGQPERAAKYVNDCNYALGTSLLYRREWAIEHPFRLAENAWGEDNNFVNDARSAGDLISVDAGQLMVARAHPGNTSKKDLGKVDYRTVPLSAIPERFFQ
jgi:hypothetical protein